MPQERVRCWKSPRLIVLKTTPELDQRPLRQVMTCATGNDSRVDTLRLLRKQRVFGCFELGWYHVMHTSRPY
jgi:hypothetical protein